MGNCASINRINMNAVVAVGNEWPGPAGNTYATERELYRSNGALFHWLHLVSGHFKATLPHNIGLTSTAFRLEPTEGVINLANIEYIEKLVHYKTIINLQLTT